MALKQPLRRTDSGTHVNYNIYAQIDIEIEIDAIIHF